MTLRLNEYEKLLRILFYITLGTGILYIAQCITGVQLLAYNLEVYEMPTENGLYRFYYSPPLNEYFLYISLFYPSLLPKKLKLAAPIIFFLVTSTTRISPVRATRDHAVLERMICNDGCYAPWS